MIKKCQLCENVVGIILGILKINVQMCCAALHSFEIRLPSPFHNLRLPFNTNDNVTKHHLLFQSFLNLLLLLSLLRSDRLLFRCCCHFICWFILVVLLCHSHSNAFTCSCDFEWSIRLYGCMCVHVRKRDRWCRKYTASLATSSSVSCRLSNRIVYYDFFPSLYVRQTPNKRPCFIVYIFFPLLFLPHISIRSVYVCASKTESRLSSICQPRTILGCSYNQNSSCAIVTVFRSFVYFSQQRIEETENKTKT